MDLAIRVTVHDKVRLVELSGVLDLATAPYARRVLFDHLDTQPEELVVVAARLRLVDAAAISMLEFIGRRAEVHGVRFRVVEPRPTVRTALEIAGADKQLGLYDDAPVAAWDPHAEPVDLEALQGGRNGWPVEIMHLLSHLAELPAGSPRHRRLRHEVIELCMPEAERLARRYSRHRDVHADLVQVASLGLIKAVDGFDLSHGVDFGAYAVPTIVGELRRHLRDRTWTLKVPRRLQELRRTVAQGREAFHQTHGRSPSAAELAGFLGISEEDVIEAIAATTAYQPASLDAPTRAEELTTVGDTISVEDHDLQLVDDRETLRASLARLPEREQRILLLRFYGNLSQSEIATQVGLSQMHVSRLLKSSLGKLRESFTLEQ